MKQEIQKAVAEFIKSRDEKEPFESSMTQKKLTMERFAEFLSSLIVFVVVICFLALIGKYLWNEVIAGQGSGNGLFTGVKPMTSIAQIIGLYILIGFLFS